MTKQKQNSPVQASQCLGCQDCKGLCRAVVELAFVPEAILHRGQPSAV